MQVKTENAMKCNNVYIRPETKELLRGRHVKCCETVASFNLHFKIKVGCSVLFQTSKNWELEEKCGEQMF
jgi:hypothetical protein